MAVSLGVPWWLVLASVFVEPASYPHVEGDVTCAARFAGVTPAAVVISGHTPSQARGVLDEVRDAPALVGQLELVRATYAQAVAEERAVRAEYFRTPTAQNRSAWQTSREALRASRLSLASAAADLRAVALGEGSGSATDLVHRLRVCRANQVPAECARVAHSHSDARDVKFALTAQRRHARGGHGPRRSAPSPAPAILDHPDVSQARNQLSTHLASVEAVYAQY